MHPLGRSIAGNAEVLASAGPGDLPPPLTTARLLTGWVFEPLPLLFVAVTVGLYLFGVSRLQRRGDAWSPWRTASFCGLGMGAVLIATSSALAAYDTVLISVHMVQHMVLSMLVPICLALGAPVTLALRTLPPRQRGRLLALLHSRYARVLSSPPVAGTLFVATPFALYLSGWYEATLRSPLLHDLNHLHFLAVGCLWFWPLLGLDPMPMRIPHLFRLLAVFVTLPFHAFLGVTILGSSRLLGGGWYPGLARTWPPTPLEDQRLAGGILWASGDLVSLAVFAVLFVQWVGASEREAAREDRRLDRLEASGGDTGQHRP